MCVCVYYARVFLTNTAFLFQILTYCTNDVVVKIITTMFVKRETAEQISKLSTPEGFSYPIGGTCEKRRHFPKQLVNN